MSRSDIERQLEDAHRQLLERDWEIRQLQQEVAHWRRELDAVLATRAWRTAERLRTWKRVILRQIGRAHV